MQLSRLYSNLDALFTPIEFNCRERATHLNVVFAEIRHPEDRTKDSHNLGKTTLVHLLDFMMLKDISSGDSFLSKHADRFDKFAFCLEIALNAGDYTTIRRTVADPGKVAIKRHDARGLNFMDAPPEEWDHVNLSIAKGRELLDGILDLQVIKPYDYRVALSYFLRTQKDYNDELQLQKFVLGPHVNWKPFVMLLFGFREEPIRQKYDLDVAIDGLLEKKADYQATVQFQEDDVSRLSAQIATKRTTVEQVERQLDAFSFHDAEKRVMYDLVNEIEAKISDLNDALYNIQTDIRRIERALESKIKFDLGAIETVFAESQIYFGDQIAKDYSELLDFNTQLTRERNASLRRRLKELLAEQELHIEERRKLNAERSTRMSVVQSMDTFDKFKRLQKDLATQKAEFVYLQTQLDKVRALADLSLQINAQQRLRGEVVDEIKAMIDKDSPIRERFATLFNQYCRQVLDHDGVFFFKQNANGNVEYEITLELAGQKGQPSSLDKGNTYKKLLCALFDLALLKVYENSAFFHFVYHDGVLEGLDNRKKNMFLELVRELVADGTIQYVLSAIDSDLPRDESTDTKIAFPDEELILRLNDDGDDGRLFKMPEF